MTHTKDEALKLALEALQAALEALRGSAGPDEISNAKEQARAAITAIKEVLATPVQPEHCGPSSSVFGLAEMILSDCGCGSDYQPLLNRVAARIMGYIDTPPAAQRKPLTAEVIRAAGGIVHKDGNVFFTNLEQLNQAIKAAHGIKENT